MVFTKMEKLYLLKAIDNLSASLVRSLRNEVAGSDIHRLREGEVRDVALLKAKVNEIQGVDHETVVSEAGKQGSVGKKV